MTKVDATQLCAKVAPARQAAYLALRKVELDGAYAHIAWQAARKELSTVDAGLAQEIVFGVLTWRRLLDHWLQTRSRLPLAKVQPEVLLTLRMALFQLRFLDRVPAYAVVNDAVEQAKAVGKSAAPFVNGVLRAALRERDYLAPILRLEDGANCDPSLWGLRLSYPDWLVERLTRTFGDAACAVLIALNQKPQRAVRVNAAKGSREAALARLEQEGVQALPSPVAPSGLRLPQGVPPTDLEAYKAGWISLQGESSMLVAPLFGDLRGKTLLDACAAPGGKGLHAAEAARGGAAVTMVELHASRAAIIREQIRRLGVSGVSVVVGDAHEVGGRYDAVLLDAPCSGIGTMARKPDIKWRMKPQDLEKLAGVQAQLLDSLAERVMRNGTLVYTTCTLSPLENEWQIQGFLKRHPEFRLRPAKELSRVAVAWAKWNRATGMTYILPQDFHGDGFFIAVLERNRDE